MIIGSRIKEARINKGLSQEELGDLLGVSKVSICGYEKGTRTPNMENFLQLLKILELDAKYVLGIEVTITRIEDQKLMELANRDIEILDMIKMNRELYNKFCNDPKRMIEKLNHLK